MKKIFYSLMFALGVLIAFPSVSLATLTMPVEWSVQENYSNDWDEAYAIDSDGSYLYIAGTDSTVGGTDSQFRIEKRNLSDGSLVYATTSNPTAGDDYVGGIKVDDSYMYLGGRDSVDGWRFEKRNLSDGSLVYTVTSTGIYIQSFTIDDTYMYAGGVDSLVGNQQWRFEKRNLSDGSLVYTINSNPSGGSETIYGLTVDSSFAYMTGGDRSSGVSMARIEKRNLSDGSLVYAVTSTPGGDISASWGESIAVDDTYIYVGNETYPAAGSDGYWRMEKRLISDGSLVTATSSNPNTGYDAPFCPKGVRRHGEYVYFCGYSVNAAWNDDSWRIEKRRASDLSLVATIEALYPSSWWATIYSTVIVEDTLYAAGANCPYGTGDCVWTITAFTFAPVPTVTSFSPGSGTVQAGEGAMALTINGTNFSASTTAVTWRGSAKTATFVSSTQMTLELSREDTLNDGTFTLVIPNDDPAGDSVNASYALTTPPNTTRSSGSSSRRTIAVAPPALIGTTPASPTPTVGAPASPVIPSVSPVSAFLKNLQYLQTDSDVLRLQQFLNTHGFAVATTGPGSPGNETNFFGSLTRQALIRFQEANAATVLIPLGLTAGTGYFGPSTRAAVNTMVQ